MSDNNRPPPLEDIDSPTKDDASLRDSYTSCFSFGPLTSHQMSPLTRFPWSSYVESSLAAMGDLLYTGSDSKNIRIWKNQKEFSWFKSNSGLVKEIVLASEKIFTGHQDGKIRVWKVSPKNRNAHKGLELCPLSNLS
ncbi:hypothetical protein L1887_23092 [Cichorium endivia]|nr:hypothetical protein L1887_23092 [Cichorium endivia]